MNTSTTGEPDAYSTIARFYDLEYDAFEADLEFYRQFARRAGGPVLELACGSGRVLRALTNLGLPLTGIDISDAMLERARARLPDSVELLLRDMQWITEPCAPANTPFGLICCAINSFLHLPDPNAQLQVLAEALHVARPDTLLILDVFAPDPGYLATLDGRLEHGFTTMLDDGARLDKWALREHDLATQTIDSTLFFDIIATDGSIRRYVDHYHTRYIYRYELEHLLERAGWQITSLFGSYELDPYDSDSERMLVLAMPVDLSENGSRW